MQEKLSRFLKKSFRLFFYTGSVSALGYSYLLYLSNQSLQEYKETLNNLKDSSSPQPYPIDSFNSSDLVYMKHNCTKGFTPGHIAKCLIHHKYKKRVENNNRVETYRQSYYDSVGVVVSYKNSKRVIFFYYDKIFDIPLEEFLALPYFCEISHSKFISEISQLDEITEEFRVKLHHTQKIIDNSWPVRTKGIVRDGVDIVLNLWVILGIAKPEKLFTMLRQTVGDLEQNKHELFSEDYCKFSSPKAVKSNQTS